jgi:dienelactone hydrolase
MNSPARISRYSFMTVIALLFVVACSPRKDAAVSAKPDDAHSRLFPFDHAAPVNVSTDSTWTINGIVVCNARFASCAPRHGQVAFTLLRPAGSGPFAGVMFFHWLGEPNGDREEFLDEALQLAREGVISLLIQGYFPWHEPPVSGTADRQQVIDQTTDARTALEILFREPDIDPQRVAYVGHDYGAMYGAIIAGLETRVKAFVLLTGMGNFSDWSLKYWPATARGGEAAYREALAPVDPVHFIFRIPPAALLMQFSNTDIYITRETAAAFIAAAPEPKSVRWYDAAHDLNIPEARTDRHAWLVQELGLSVSH